MRRFAGWPIVVVVLAKTDRDELLPRERHGRIVDIMLRRDYRINFARVCVSTFTKTRKFQGNQL